MARLPAKVALALVTYVDDRLATNPVRLSKPLTGELSHLRGSRNGDYRVLIAVDEDDEVVRIVRVDHRAHVYRP